MSRMVEPSRDEDSLGEDASKQGRRINNIDADEDITLVNDQIDANAEMFDVNALTGDEVFPEQEVAAKDVNLTIDEVTLAQAIAALKSVKPKVKGVVIQEPSTTTTTISSQQPSQDKAEIDEEERISRDEEEKIDEANIAWDDIQAKFDVDYQLAERLQAEEQEQFIIEQKTTFTDLVEGSSKRAGEELEQESTKKQKVDEDKKTAELKQLVEIIPDEEKVTINVIPLVVKSPRIVDWKIHKEGKKSYYQIIRVDGKSQMYRVFSQMLKSFDMEDLEDLYKLIKAKYGSTRPVEDMDYLLWNDMKIMFEPHSMHIYVLVEKQYPLTPPTITDMLNKKLQVDHFSKMGRIVGIKSLLNAGSITAALINVNAA
ncbi:hypothetical protein Tco_0542224 [Tanacetum coccineum]